MLGLFSGYLGFFYVIFELIIMNNTAHCVVFMVKMIYSTLRKCKCFLIAANKILPTNHVFGKTNYLLN